MSKESIFELIAETRKPALMSFKSLVSNKLNKLSHITTTFTYRGKEPQYGYELSQAFYILRYFEAYLVEYFHCYSLLLSDHPKPPRLLVLSLGCGACIDLHSLQAAAAYASPPAPNYAWAGIDKVDWHFKPCCNTRVDDFLELTTFNNPPKYNVLFLGKSLSRIGGQTPEKMTQLAKKLEPVTDFVYVIASFSVTNEQFEKSLLASLIEGVSKQHGFTIVKRLNTDSMFLSAAAPSIYTFMRNQHNISLPKDDTLDSLHNVFSMCRHYIELDNCHCDCNCPTKLRLAPIRSTKYFRYSLVKLSRGSR